MKIGSSRELAMNEQYKEIQLRAVSDGEIITCRVSRAALEALVSRECVGSEGLLQIAYYYFELLTEHWSDRIELGMVELDGSVLLRQLDVLGVPPRAKASRRA